MIERRVMHSDREQRFHHFVMAMAKALFSERVHLLRLTEIVRNQVRPNEEGLMILPAELDEEMKKLAFDFVLMMMPEEYHVELLQLRQSWVIVQ
jgi:hypothetical protein